MRVRPTGAGFEQRRAGVGKIQDLSRSPALHRVVREEFEELWIGHVVGDARRAVGQHSRSDGVCAWKVRFPLRDRLIEGKRSLFVELQQDCREHRFHRLADAQLHVGCRRNSDRGLSDGAESNFVVASPHPEHSGTEAQVGHLAADDVRDLGGFSTARGAGRGAARVCCGVIVGTARSGCNGNGQGDRQSRQPHPSAVVGGSHACDPFDVEIEQPTPSNVPIGRIYRSWKEEGSDRPYRRNCCSSAVLIRVPRPVPLAGPALAEARR